MNLFIPVLLDPGFPVGFLLLEIGLKFGHVFHVRRILQLQCVNTEICPVSFICVSGFARLKALFENVAPDGSVLPSML